MRTIKRTINITPGTQREYTLATPYTIPKGAEVAEDAWSVTMQESDFCKVVGADGIGWGGGVIFCMVPTGGGNVSVTYGVRVFVNNVQVLYQTDVYVSSGLYAYLQILLTGLKPGDVVRARVWHNRADCTTALTIPCVRLSSAPLWFGAKNRFKETVIKRIKVPSSLIFNNATLTTAITSTQDYGANFKISIPSISEAKDTYASVIINNKSTNTYYSYYAAVPKNEYMIRYSLGVSNMAFFANGNLRWLWCPTQIILELLVQD